jgi:predicted RNA-binding Zn-ribbon protein involved in translation (DUF1610 family)
MDSNTVQKKYSFQNPIRQNFRQKKIVSEYLGLHESTIHTVIYFVGDCKFKSSLPNNVIKSGLGSYIKNFRDRILPPEEISRVLNTLEKHVSGSTLTTEDHVQSLRERHSSTSVCPKCGSKLIERTAKKGLRAGTNFLGCEKYPRCRFTK